MLPQELLDVLACPRCRGELAYEPEPEGLSCPACRLRFAVQDGIPNLLLDEAEGY
jgi:hypothetical protein